MNSITIQELFNNELTLTLSEFSEIDGNVNLVELMVISGLVKKLKPEVIFEIGTFDGRTALNMALNTNGKVYTLDLPKNIKSDLKLETDDLKYINKDKSGDRFSKKYLNIEQLYGDSAKFDFTPYRNEIDFMFVDGSHSYEYIIKDSWTAIENVKSGGCILWHDYSTWIGVTKGLNELSLNEKFKNIKRIEETTLCILFK